MKYFILDVDGVLTTGQFLYSSDGKVMKVFGPDDNESLGLLQEYLTILFITGDKRGFEISKKRIVDDMGYSLEYVSTKKRIKWISERYNPKDVIYMGDGVFDCFVMKNVGYSIAPSSGHYLAKENADHITMAGGGNRAVSEACLHILDKFFKSFEID